MTGSKGSNKPTTEMSDDELETLMVRTANSRSGQITDAALGASLHDDAVMVGCGKEDLSNNQKDS